MARTSFIIKLLQNLSDDLPYTLQSLDVLFGVVEILLQALDL